MNLADPRTFARAYEDHSPGVYGTALRVLGDPVRAQDVVQDVFLRLWRHPRKFDAERGDLGTYLRLMARSRALDLWREDQAAGRARDRLEHAVAVDRPAAEPAPDEATLRSEVADELRGALRELPDAQREAVVLSTWGGMTAAEIARRGDVPLGTAKSRIRLGLERLRGALPEPA
jgi:RNA polymerase sigma-70 factor (ECF subfamily)